MKINSKNQKDVLANTLGVLILNALKDLHYVENSKKYVVDMDTWYKPLKPLVDICQVCFAGAVIARQLGDGDDHKIPECFSDKIAAKLEAIDSIRIYNVLGALYELYRAGIYNKKQRELVEDIEDFKDLMDDFGKIGKKFLHPKWVAIRDGLFLDSNADKPSYKKDPKQWRLNMTKIAKALIKLEL